MHRLWLVLLVACGNVREDAPDADAATGTLDTAVDAARCPAPTTIDTATAAEIGVLGEPGAAMGIFDASVVYPSGAPGGAMAYSAVPDQHSIRTRIALSQDHGASWTFVAEANVPETATIASSDATECPGGQCSGFLISEVSALVFDADDPDAARRWKLFAHRYLASATDQLHYRIGTITLQTAPDPQGPWTAPVKTIGWTSPSAFTTANVPTNINSLAGTEDCIALTEPSALWIPGSLQLALGCAFIAGGAPLIRIVLVRSVDHGATWHPVSTLLGPGDADCLAPGASINAANLFVAGGQAFISATPSDATGYHGCAIYRITDLATGAVDREPVRTIVPTPDRFSGACGVSEAGGGYVVSVGFLEQARRFRMFRGGAMLP